MAKSAQDAFFSRADSFRKGHKDNEEQGDNRRGNGDEHAAVPPWMLAMAAESHPENLPELLNDLSS